MRCIEQAKLVHASKASHLYRLLTLLAVCLASARLAGPLHRASKLALLALCNALLAWLGRCSGPVFTKRVNPVFTDKGPLKTGLTLFVNTGQEC